MHARGGGDSGEAGASARARAQSVRRRREREAAARGRRARVLRALTGPSASERRSLAEQRHWASGAEGEEMLAAQLAQRCPTVSLLHDRGVPGRRSNIDHIAVAPSGVWVIDTKRYRGKIRVRRPLFGREQLLISGRDRTKLIAGLDRQVELVRAAVASSHAGIPIFGCLCFVPPEGIFADVGLPLLRTLRVDGYPLYFARRLCKQLNLPGPLTGELSDSVLGLLATRFPPR